MVSSVPCSPPGQARRWCSSTASSATPPRYGNYSADAVARVIVGRELCDRTGGELCPVPTPPERVRRWLEAIHVEDADLSDYDRLIDGLEEPGQGDDDAEE